MCSYFTAELAALHSSSNSRQWHSIAELRHMQVIVVAHTVALRSFMQLSATYMGSCAHFAVLLSSALQLVHRLRWRSYHSANTALRTSTSS
jgi:hypothetical protein